MTDREDTYHFVGNINDGNYESTKVQKMERSIADELYSEMLKPTNVDSSSRLTTDKALDSSVDSDGDDLWYDDEDCDKTDQLEKASDMDREWQKRREQFHTMGYRDGLMAGKEASAQEGFNIGFKESVFVGQRWGFVRGVTSALASLPNALKERLVEPEDKRKKFQQLHESVLALSTKDMLKLFHDDLKDKLTEQGKNSRTDPSRELRGESSKENVLENYVREFTLLIRDSPEIKVHQENDL